MSNTIHIELPGIEAKLDQIIELLKQTPVCQDCAKNVAEAAVASTAAAIRQATQEVTETTEPEAPAPVPDPEPAPAPAPEQPTITHEDVKKKVVALSAADKKAEVKEIVLSYARNVASIPEDKLPEVWDKLTALKAVLEAEKKAAQEAEKKAAQEAALEG